MEEPRPPSSGAASSYILAAHAIQFTNQTVNTVTQTFQSRLSYRVQSARARKQYRAIADGWSGEGVHRAHESYVSVGFMSQAEAEQYLSLMSAAVSRKVGLGWFIPFVCLQMVIVVESSWYWL